jgi:hypothetical protein
MRRLSLKRSVPVEMIAARDQIAPARAALKRSTAALALVVYLLVPPFNGGPDSTACASGSTAACVRQTFNPAAPIGNWRLLQAFDTAEACKTFRDDRIQMLEKCPGPQPCPATPELIKFNLDMIQQSRCVSRDDLLKEVR